jgi:hypothetical protein
MKGLGLGLTIAWLAAGPALGAESAADAIKAFGLIGTWSIDCSRGVEEACNTTTGCGARTTYEVSPTGQPMISNIVATLVAGHPRIFETTIEQATRIGDDKIAITSIQRTDSGVRLMWWRQPGETWQIVLMKVGDKIRTYQARRDDGKKISVEDGFEVRVPPGTHYYDALPDRWVRSDKETPLFERCGMV